MSGWDFSDYTPPADAPSRQGGASGPFGAPGVPPGGGFGGAQGGVPAGSPFGGTPAQAPLGAGGGAPFGGSPQGGHPFAGVGQGSASPFGGPATAPAGADLFGSSRSLGGAPDRLEAVSAPVGWLFAAIGLALACGIAASILGSIPAVAIACWALAGPVVICLLAVYLMKDVRLRTHLTYSPPLWGPMVYGIGLVVTFIAVMIASLQIAFWVGRL